MRYAACPVCLDEPPVPRRRASHGTKGARARAAVKFFVLREPCRYCFIGVGYDIIVLLRSV